MIERIEINLLPVEYRVHHKNFQIKREVAYPLIGAGVIAVALALLTVGFKNSTSILRNEIIVVQSSIDQNRPIQNEITRLREDNMVIQQKINALELINVNREKWVKIMEEFSGRLPEYTWLVSIKEEVTDKTVIYVEGRTYSFPAVANYMSSLNDCDFVSSVDLSQIEKMDVKDNVYRFALSCAIDQMKTGTDEKPSDEVATAFTGNR